MNNRKALILISILILLTSCQSLIKPVRSVTAMEGGVFIYMEPFPPEAEGIRVTLEGISAVAEKGTPEPLNLKMKELSIRNLMGQRLIAMGDLPSDRYKGILISIKAISYTSDGRVNSVEVDEGPIFIEIPFEVRKDQIPVIWIKLRADELVRSDGHLPILFSAYIPERPLLGLGGFITNPVLNLIAVFDRKRRNITGMITSGREPMGVAVDPLHARAYVALSGEDAVEVIDTQIMDKITRIYLRGGDRPRELAITPDGSMLLVGNMGSNTISIIDTRLLIESSRLSVGQGPRYILIDKRGERAYVFNTFSNTVSVIDIRTMRILINLAAETGPIMGAFNSKGDRLYIIHEYSPYLLVYDTVTFSVVRREYAGPSMSSIVIDPATDLIYLSSSTISFISIRHPSSLLPISFIQSDAPARYLFIDKDENTLYIVIPEKGAVSVVDLYTGRIISILEVSGNPYQAVTSGGKGPSS